MGHGMSFYQIVEAQLQRLNVFSDPDSTLFWPFLVVVFPLTVYAWQREDRKSRTLLNYLLYLFPKGLIRSPSARQDVLFFIFGPMLMSGIGYFILVSTAAVPGFISALLTDTIGYREASSVTLSDRIAVTVLSYLAIDFGFYVVHYMQHNVPALWKYHRVHHSATVLTPLTDFRAHPIQLGLTLLITSALSSIVIGIFLYVNGTDVSEINYLGINIVNMILFGFATVLRHSHVWISFGPLSYLVISPAMHQIHHSCEERHWNKNLSGNLAIWDWMFGTIYVPKSRERFRVGLVDREGRKMTRKSFVDLIINP
jgi:sterol desaturase/sphingolipid hydroxylase (fatty acid hydroxylase superfamily)